MGIFEKNQNLVPGNKKVLTLQQKQEKEQLKTKIENMTIACLNWKDICKTLQIDKNKYYRLKKELDRENVEPYLDNRAALIADYMVGMDDVIFKANQLYLERKNPETLKVLKDSRKDKAQMQQSLGLLPKAVEQIQADIRVVTFKEPDWLRAKVVEHAENKDN